MTARQEPHDVVRESLEPGSGKGGMAELRALRVLAALAEAGWKLVHDGEARELVSYRPVAPTIEGSLVS